MWIQEYLNAFGVLLVEVANVERVGGVYLAARRDQRRRVLVQVDELPVDARADAARRGGAAGRRRRRKEREELCADAGAEPEPEEGPGDAYASRPLKNGCSLTSAERRPWHPSRSHTSRRRKRSIRSRASDVNESGSSTTIVIVILSISCLSFVRCCRNGLCLRAAAHESTLVLYRILVLY